MSSSTGFPSLAMWHIRQAYRAGMASISGGKTTASYSYQPLDLEASPTTTSPPLSSSTSTATATRRGPRTLLQTRWGKLVLGGSLLVFMILIASTTNVPSTVRQLTGGRITNPDVPPTPQASDKPAPDSPAWPDKPPTGVVPDETPDTPATPETDKTPATSNTPPPEPLTLESARASISKQEYIDAVLRDPVEGLLDVRPIRKMCDTIKFQEGLVWHCEMVNGGIGNVGNMWINCVRYAMEAGATTIIIPRIGARSEDNLSQLGDDEHSVEMDTLYDVDYFITAWKEACPQMRAVRSDKEVANLPPVDKSPAMRANGVGKLPRMGELIIDATGWRAAFEAWLNEKVPASKTMSSKTPVRIRQRLALSHWNRENQPHDFAIAFPRVFRFPDHLRRLAAATLWAMEKQTGVPMVSDAVLFPEFTIDPSDTLDDASTMVPSLGRNRLAPQGFLGVHLRVAADAAKAGWPGYDTQAPAYLDEAQRHNLSTVYLATGSKEHRNRFIADAKGRNVHVVSKEALLDKDELEELGKLTWDQQAVVDFEVLIHSSHFAGFARSSFSWIVAIRRSILPEAGKPVIHNPLNLQHRAVEDRVGHRGAHVRRAEAPAAAEAEPAVAIATAPATPPAPVTPAKEATPAVPATPPKQEPVVEKYRDALSLVIGRFDGMTICAIWP
ncbi:hypothetical protein SPBR_00348 [Sporothrix brasiliensis 5110]|uniref:Alternative oxidase n=2 Tax=Sporothrix brasiliensis TaxID=545650 RepID=A0A0C2IN64_9PEZI|nr:uncharacterized protein SPBR_00348 [Sporothrix brasiliensis 5110]AIZ74363.1 hypothetical protein [Sporothrix brasiliensis]KIH90476.1 hypothetical protein SPBR_00348 [Sporothrix brasiliensis 5110]